MWSSRAPLPPKPSPSRRAIVFGVPAFVFGTVAARDARAELTPLSAPVAPPPSVRVNSHVVRVATDERGTTVTMELDHAPFPTHASGSRDATVIAFIPRHHRPTRDGSVSTVVHFHGHGTTAERTIVAHQLREQLYESKQNAILVVPQLAVNAADSAAGKLETQGGLSRMLADVLRTAEAREVRIATGAASLAAPASVGRVCVSAHSGGYHAAAAVLRGGGVAIQEVYLFDALYAEMDVFRDWVIAGRGKPMAARHKLVSYFTAGHTEQNTTAMFTQLTSAGVACVHENIEGTLSREALTRAEAVSIRTRIAHGAVTSELNGLRDCLYASALRRNLKSSWFAAKHGSRPLERRR